MGSANPCGSERTGTVDSVHPPLVPTAATGGTAAAGGSGATAATPAPASTAPTLVTFGHGRLDSDGLLSLVRRAGIELVVDVRRFPGSRHNPAAGREVLPATLLGGGVRYRWDERLGGRRHLTRAEDEASPDTWWRVEAFRAYAAHTRTVEFRAGIEDLLIDVAAQRTAVMCSEAVWWRCHRRLIADVVMVEHGVPARHLMHDGRLVTAEPSDGARLDPASGHLVWDGGAAG